MTSVEDRCEVEHIFDATLNVLGNGRLVIKSLDQEVTKMVEPGHQIREPAGQQRVAITTAEFSAKAKSKAEIYRLLTVDAGAYLPEYAVCTIYFLRQIVRGEKRL